VAAYFEIDDVIDPADTLRWVRLLFEERSGDRRGLPGKRRPNIDAW
jgi:hypothetical protein